MHPSGQGTEIRNLILAMGLSVAILFGWEYFYMKPQREAAQAARQEQAARESTSITGDVAPAAAPLSDLPQAEAASKSRDALLEAAPRLTINTPSLKGSINLRGLRFDDLTLSNYQQTTDAGSPPVILLSPAEGEAGYFAEFGFLARNEGLKLPDANSEWQTTASALTANQPVTFFWENGEGLRFEREITLDEHYMFTLRQRIINASGSDITLYPYGRIHRHYADKGEHFFILHEGPLAVLNGVLEEVAYKDLRDNAREEFKQVTGWIGITDKYWLTALVPDSTQPMHAKMHYLEQGGKGSYQVDYTAEGRRIAAGETLQLQQHFFAGAKRVSLLDAYMQRYHIPLFDRAVDFGWFYFLTKPIFHALDYFYHLLGNFGLAIMLLTVCIKLVLFPLANKSYKAMSQMKLLMPKIQEIKERHKDDKMAQNQAIMKMYQQEKINPASGCLPILIQIPIFFSLYKVLFVTIEMRHADFYGWIHDLSAPDPTSIFNLFGLLPFASPSWLHIGAWPLIMCATMVIQMRLNPKPADPTQALVMQWMPFIFLFLFAGFPAGLVIYWAWNNTLSILQQYLIMKRHGVK